jgi:hypothetical protein
MVRTPPLARNGIVDFRVEIVALRNVRVSNWINPFLAAIKTTGVKRGRGRRNRLRTFSKLNIENGGISMFLPWRR